MNFPSLRKAILIKRYKRFLADINVNDNLMTIHCANTGAMTGCAEKGDFVWYSTSDNLKRKYPCSWELTEKANGDLICINTQRANHIVGEALSSQILPPFKGYRDVKPEVKYGEENSRIDFLLEGENLVPCYIEVKSVTLLRANGEGQFPDAKTTRGQKHLRELISLKQQGKRAVILFAILHSGITYFSPAKDIDPYYAELLQEAITHGVEIFCYKAEFKTQDNIPTQLVLTNQSLPIMI